MKKKVGLIVSLVCVLLFLAGWAKQSVKLLDETKLIDLEAALQVCLHGSSMSEGDADGDNPDQPVSTQAPTDPKEDIDEERTIVISVRGCRISYDAGEEVELNKLEFQIRQDYRDKTDFLLVDDYAEAHVYRHVQAILLKLRDEMGLEYTEGRGE